MDYLPITLTNYQSTAVAANTPLAIGTSNSLTGNIIGFNAIAYQQYETCNLNNAEFFFANGTIISSWLEGNVFNEQDANTLCTSASSTNALAASANILYWVNYHWPSVFLPANTGTFTQNTIYLGWAGNTLTTSTNLLSNTVTGEAPQLSCNTPYNTISGCNAGQYGEYDTGNVVFGAGLPADMGFYSNFTGLGQFTVVNAIANNGLIIDNGTTTNSVITKTKSYNPSNVVMDALWYSVVAGTGSSAGNWVAVGLAASATLANPSLFLKSDFNAQPIEGTLGAGTANQLLPSIANTNKQWMVSSFSTNSFADIYTKNYNQKSTTSNNILNQNLYLVFVNNYVNELTYNTLRVQWVRARLIPPNDVLPGVTYGSVQIPPQMSIGAATNTIVDAGQYQSFLATISGGTPNYQYTFNAVNSVTTGTITNTLTVTGQSATTYLWTYYINSLDPSNSQEEANVFAIDSHSAFANSVYSNKYTINPALGTPTLTVTNSLIDYGQYSTITPSCSGGSPNYVENIVISNSITLKAVNSLQIITSSCAANTIYFPSWYAGNTLQVNVVITDSATTNEITNSIYTPLGFNAIPVAGVLTESNTIINNGQYSRLTATSTFGTSPVSYNYFSQASCGGASIGSGASILVNPSSTTTYSFNAVDSATTPISVCSASNTITVNPALAWGTWTALNNPQNTGSTQVLTAKINNGIGPYTYNFIVYNSVGLVANYLVSNAYVSNSFIFMQQASWGIGTFTANIIVIDSSSFSVSNSLTYAVITPIVYTQFFCNSALLANTLESNTIYQNSNTLANVTTLSITTNEMATLWIGTTPGTLILSKSEGSPSEGLINYTMSSPIPIGGYFKVNYTAVTTMTEACSSSSGTGFISVPSLTIPKYATTAIIMFALGILLFIFSIFNLFGIVKLPGGMPGGILSFTISFTAIILLLYSGFYQNSITSNSYHITQPGGTTDPVVTVGVASTPLASIPLIAAIIILFSIAGGVIGALKFYAIIFFVKEKRKKERERLLNE